MTAHSTLPCTRLEDAYEPILQTATVQPAAAQPAAAQPVAAQPDPRSVRSIAWAAIMNIASFLHASH